MTRPARCRAIARSASRPTRKAPRRLTPISRSKSAARGLEQRLLDQDAGVVDQHVQPAEPGQHGVEQRQHLCLVGHVRPQREGPLAGRSRRRPPRSSPAARGRRPPPGRPRPRSASAIARPIPLAPPVTSARLPASAPVMPSPRRDRRSRPGRSCSPHGRRRGTDRGRRRHRAPSGPAAPAPRGSASSIAASPTPARAATFVSERSAARVRTQPGQTALTRMPLRPELLGERPHEADVGVLGGDIGGEVGRARLAPDRGGQHDAAARPASAAPPRGSRSRCRSR